MKFIEDIVSVKLWATAFHIDKAEAVTLGHKMRANQENIKCESNAQ